jgi:hypothetical protein
VRQEGFACEEANAAGYTLLEIKEAGYVEGLKAAGFSLEDVRGAGFVLGVN